MKQFIKSITPAPLLNAYHYCLAILGALIYRSPSRKLFVIGVTGTKGKSTTSELIAAILAEAGHTVALASTIRFAVGKESEPNLFKMTMPGRFFLQKFLRQAVGKGATHAVIEMTSEGAKQFRHSGLALDALVFTNLAPEHIESHGGLEHYVDAKLSLARALARSPKRPRIVVANADDTYGKDFLNIDVEIKAPFSLKDAEPYNADDKSVRFVWPARPGRRQELFTVPLPGVFNLKNILAAMTLCDAMGVETSTMKKALEHIGPIAGRAERVEAGQPFVVVVDYAHTPDSLRALYETYSSNLGASLLGSKSVAPRLICVLGSTGGGRDTWKRPALGKIADEFCDSAYLTNEDPYDEDPQKIIDEVAGGFTRVKPRMVLNRREAIREALKEAFTLRQAQGDQNEITVLVTGKGTDPYLMGAKGAKEPWSDKKVVQEELKNCMTDREQ
ncbi:MAG: UDP-N-acetylmuramyl-tripeptide synthetase [Patescibacteria group bacterium]|nr:UDP-N-acetylmuramyl-tripeptide synthetase [Patescibacteria group bacterium]